MDRVRRSLCGIRRAGLAGNAGVWARRLSGTHGRDARHGGHFFFERGAHVDIELCPLAGLPAVGLLCERGYRPIEIASVVYQPVIEPAVAQPGSIKVHVVGPEESQLWATVSARGWAAERPDLFDFVRKSGEISAVRDRSLCLLAEFDGEPGAAGALCLNEGVALFSGSATVPELRRRGLQGALLRERMRYAFGAGCDLAMMVAEAGSTSQRNAERNGFRIAYTRTKWRRALVPKP